MTKMTTDEVTYALIDTLTRNSPMVRTVGWLPPDQILLARGSQRWLITVREIPGEMPS